MSSSNDGRALPTPNQAIAQIHQEDQFHVVDLEQNEKSATGGHDAYVALSNPELEKRVLRKIDMHVPPLVTFLCRCSDKAGREHHD